MIIIFMFCYALICGDSLFCIVSEERREELIRDSTNDASIATIA
jgi:hypothetical protein